MENEPEYEENIKEIMQEIKAEIVVEKPEWMRIIMKALEEQNNRNRLNKLNNCINNDNTALKSVT